MNTDLQNMEAVMEAYNATTLIKIVKFAGVHATKIAIKNANVPGKQKEFIEILQPFMKDIAATNEYDHMEW